MTTKNCKKCGKPFTYFMGNIKFCNKCRKERAVGKINNLPDVPILNGSFVSKKELPTPYVIYECACKTKNKVNHHFDYSEPYKVIVLCKSCHIKEHHRLYKVSIMNNEKA
jgi:hypothetical protein